jgi:hypothetical protein
MIEVEMFSVGMEHSKVVQVIEVELFFVWLEHSVESPAGPHRFPH